MALHLSTSRKAARRLRDLAMGSYGLIMVSIEWITGSARWGYADGAARPPVPIPTAQHLNCSNIAHYYSVGAYSHLCSSIQADHLSSAIWRPASCQTKPSVCLPYLSSDTLTHGCVVYIHKCEVGCHQQRFWLRRHARTAVAGTHNLEKKKINASDAIAETP